MADTPAPGMPGNPLRLTDPMMMRALAHPARMAILMHLGLRGPTTATECADVAGLSPSACSYHLRALARYGVVEEAPDSAADGRQRPWRIKMMAFNIEPRPDDDPAALLAGRFLAESVHESWQEDRARFYSRESEYPADWRRAVGETYDVAHVTPDELNELRRQITAVVEPYRRLDPAERPPGALPVQLLTETFPYFNPEETT